MTIKITGKNVDLGDSLRSYAADRANSAITKYAGQCLSGTICLEKNQIAFVTHCALHLASGLDVQAAGEAVDAYASIDAALERVEKRLRRYNRRLKSHGQGIGESVPLPSGMGVDYVIDAGHFDGELEEDGAEQGAPAVIAEKPARVMSMTVGNAVLHMDLADRQFLVFRNAAHGGVNVVYKRDDGNIGWIDPSGAFEKKE